MAITKPDPRDADQLKREADAIRADLDRTLDALERKLSPRQIANRSLERVRRNGAELLHKASGTAKKHPLPVLLASAGLVWLFGSRGRKTANERAHPSWTRARSSFDHPAERLQASAPLSRASHTLDTARERAVETRGQIGRMLRKRPVMYGTMAAALGAAIGSALPATRVEHEVAARARDSAGPLLRRAADELQRRAGFRRSE